MDFFSKKLSKCTLYRVIFHGQQENRCGNKLLSLPFVFATVTKAAGSLSIFFLPLKRTKRRQPRDKSTRLITHLAGDGDMKAYRKCQAFLSGERDVVVVAAQHNCTAEAKSEGNKSECGRLFQSHVIRIIYLTACRSLVARLAFLVLRVCFAQVEKISAVTPWCDKRRHHLCFSVFLSFLEFSSTV